ncbi:MAG: hypothetical protein V3T88_07560 [Nitrosomonadaceae bacterium]
MSYDMDIGYYWANYTYNLSGLFHDILPGGLYGLDGLTGSKDGNRLQHAINLAKCWDKKKLEKYNPSNDWGNSERTLEVLEEFMAACKENPRKKVSVT